MAASLQVAVIGLVNLAIEWRSRAVNGGHVPMFHVARSTCWPRGVDSPTNFSVRDPTSVAMEVHAVALRGTGSSWRRRH